MFFQFLRSTMNYEPKFLPDTQTENTVTLLKYSEISNHMITTLLPDFIEANPNFFITGIPKNTISRVEKLNNK